MMYVQTTQRKDGPSVRVPIVQSYRNHQGKPRYRVVKSVGSAPFGPR
ncbi:MAG: hypothetical protein OXC92_03505 [Flavobacteriaceae bacterium]|nr:hypothetical protein [Flavobacteriaceae bacterium]